MPKFPFRRSSRIPPPPTGPAPSPPVIPPPPTGPAPSPPAQVVTDNPAKLDQRRKDLYQQTINVIVTGKGVVRRTKRSLVSYGHSKFQTGIQARDFWVFTVGVGAVIAVAGAAAFAVIGWWALIPGVVVGILVALLTWYFSKKWTKHTVAVWLRELDGHLEVNPNYLPPVDLEKDGPKVESILTVLMNDHGRLESKLKKYYKGNEWLVRSRLKKAFQASVNRHDLGTTLKKIRGSKASFTEDDADDVRKLAILIARERAYLSFSRKYLTKLENTIKEYYDNLATVDDAVDLFVKRQISLHPHHGNCDQNVCFGPGREDLNVTPITGKIATIDRTTLAGMRTQATGIRTGGTSMGTVSKALGDLEDHEDKIIMGIEHSSALVTAAISEALEGTLPKATAEAAGGTAPDLIFSPIGFVVGVAVNELIQSFTVNRPTQKRAGKIRQAVHDKTGAELDEEIKKNVAKGKGEMLTRALNKVHSHYLKRMADRFEKLETAYRTLSAGPDDPTSTTEPWPHTCSDAVKMTRYLLKVYHYCEKAYSHIIFLHGALSVVEARLQRLETLANTPLPTPPPPPGPAPSPPVIPPPPTGPAPSPPGP